MGPDVTIIYRLRDREFDRADVEIQFGVDANRDGEIGEDEYSACSEVPYDPTDTSTTSSGTIDLKTSPGVGTIQYFVWDSLADLKTARYVTQDYVYTTDGRVQLDEFGDAEFQDFPGVRIRIRPTANGVTGAWKSTDAFDVNSNNPPTLRIDGVVDPTPLDGENTVNEEVLVNWTAIDPDLNRDPDVDPADWVSDAVTIAVDWVQVDAGFNPATADLDTLESLPWQAATTGQLGMGTDSLASTPTGVSHTWSWDSVADAGTMNGHIILRMRPLDEKLEVGTWRYMMQSFHLDNYTIFTDPDAQLPDPSFKGRAVLLSTGEVLYAGGTSGTEPSQTAAIFYPGLSQTTKGTLAAINPGLNEARMGHTSTLLEDGTVLVVGGQGALGEDLDTLELFDPEARAFQVLSVNLGTARFNHTATRLRDGRVLIAGGENDEGFVSEAEVYDPATREVVSVGDMGEARTMAQAARLPAGRVLIAGGQGAAGSLQTVEIFDPIANAFVATDIANDMGEKRAGLALTATTHDPIAAVASGGSDAGTPSATIDRFDWEQDSFTAAAESMADARAGHISVLLGDGQILLAGGMTVGGTSVTADIYDVAGDRIDIPNGDLVVPVSYSTVVCLENGRPAIFGGQDDTGAATAQIQIFTPDGGFNYAPIAQVRTPTAVEPWAFGVRFYWRATDSEGDDVRINAQFRIKPSASDDSNLLPAELLDVWLPASMKDQTVLGEISSGVTGLSSRSDFVTELQNPMDAPDVDPGEHLFIWYTEEDIPKGNYDNVFFRLGIEGATPGETATSGRFSITENAPVIARVQDPLNDNGHIVVPYYLQDSDTGDLADVTWEYGVDLNGDGKIVETDFETWASVTRSTVSVTIGTDTYTDSGITGLTTGAQDGDADNDFTTADGIPWGKLHYLVWDSVYDLGSPNATRNDIILRATPYDYPPTDSSNPSLGIANQMGGFDLTRDPNGLVLESWEPQENSTAGSGYTYSGLKLDEPIVLTFSTPVDKDSVTRDTIRFTKVGGTGERVSGYFHVDNSSGKGVVTFYPQVQEIPARTDIFEASAGYSLEIPGYDPLNRTVATVEQDGAAADDTNGRFCLATNTDTSALMVGSGALLDSEGPTVGPLVSPTTTTNVPTGTTIELSFSERIAATSVDANGFLVTTQMFTGVDSVVYGEMSLKNTTTWDGSKIVHTAVLVFTPDSALPILASIEVAAKTGLTDLYGNSLLSASVTTFDTTTTGTKMSGEYDESFDDTADRDNALTTAFWGAADPAGLDNTTMSGGGLGVSGSLTGMHHLGTGTDDALIVWDADKKCVLDTGTHPTLNFTNLTVPTGHTLVLRGSKPAVIRVWGDVRVEGTIDASGEDGDTGVCYDYWDSISGPGVLGGTAGAGGGDGGGDAAKIGPKPAYEWAQSTKVTLTDGKPGYQAPSGSIGKSGECGFYGQLNGSYYYDIYGSGGSGGGHANSGDNGTRGMTNTTSSYYSRYIKTAPTGGSAWGASTLSSGLEGGSGGGAGGGGVLGYPVSSTSYSIQVGYVSGGSGGGGGGAMQIVAGGTVIVTEAGKILANGGDGGDSVPPREYMWIPVFYKRLYPYGNSYPHYGGNAYTGFTPGAGGGGSGGTIHVIAGKGHALHGIVDVSGGEGGEGMSWRYQYPRYGYDYYEYETYGGDGGDGRLRVDGPTLVSASQGVNFQGVVAVGTATAISGGSGSTSWSVSGGTTVDTDSGAVNGVTPTTWDSTNYRFNVKDFTVPSGATLTVTGSRPLVIYASGDVDVAGTIDISGADAKDWSLSSWTRASSSTGFRAPVLLSGAKGVAGGGSGGDSGPSNVTSSYVSTPHRGLPGKDAAGAPGSGAQVSPLWEPVEYSYSYAYYSGTKYERLYYTYGGGGGSGGGSAEPGNTGGTNGRWTSMQLGAGPFGEVGAPSVNVDTVSEATLTGGGGGAGGGLNAGYRYRRYSVVGSTLTVSSTTYYSYGNAGAGGAGGGAMMIRASGKISLGSSAQIDATGGDGSSFDLDYKTHSYSGRDLSSFSSPGGGGGGGNVLLEAKSGFSLANGCNINASGGEGGVLQWDGSYSYTGTYARTYTRLDMKFQYGGDGARGGIVLRAEMTPEVMNLGQVNLGSSGTFASVATFVGTRVGVSAWQDAKTHAPDFVGSSMLGTGTADLFFEGAHVDPMTGSADANSSTGWVKISAASDIDKMDGYRFFRFKCELTGTTVSGAVPSIDQIKTTWESWH